MRRYRHRTLRWTVYLLVAVAGGLCPLAALAQADDGADSGGISQEETQALNALLAAATEAQQEPAPEPREAPAQQPEDADEPEEQDTQEPPAEFQLPPGIDLGEFDFTGADIQVEVVGDSIVIRGAEEDVAKLELLLQYLDRVIVLKQIEVVTVKERDAREVAQNVQAAIREALKKRLPDDLPTLTPVSSNIILISALDQDLDWVKSIISEVDAVPPMIPDFETLLFFVEHRRAADVANELKTVLTTIMQKQGGRPEDLQVIPNNANNTIMVVAPVSERERIQGLINQIDVEPVKGWGEIKLTLFPLLHSDAGALSDVITNLLASQEQQEQAAEVARRFTISRATAEGQVVDLPPIDLSRPIQITAHDDTNSLIVATSEENVLPIGELIRLLDGVPLGEQMGVRVFALKFADAESLGTLLSDMFESGKNLPEEADGESRGAVPEGVLGSALVYNVTIQADARTNTLVIAGREEQLVLAQMMIDELDVPARSLKFPLRLLSLEYSDATRMSEVLTELFQQRMDALEATGASGSAVERERVFLTVDIPTNTLIVSASDENYDEIVSIVESLDVKPARLFDQIRIVRLDRLSAADLMEKITELWERRAQLRQEAEQIEDLPVVVADERSNALLIASSLEDYEEIARLVTALEAEPMIEATQIFPLKFADATVLAQQLDDLFQEMEGLSEGGAFQAPAVIADARINALIVAGSRDVMERAEDLIGRLDVEAGPMTATFAIYPLTHGSAIGIASRMQELFDARAQGQEQADRTPVVIMAEESSNSIVASASRDDHIVIADLLKMLDRPSSIARQFEIFPLRFAKAERVAESLDTLFEPQGDAEAGRADAIAVQADVRTNSLIVWASPTQLENIRQVIDRLDTTTPSVEMMMKVIPLKQALAEDFANVLKETLLGAEQGAEDQPAVIVSFIDKLADGTEIVRKLLRQDITITPDPRTNSLMVMAPADSMNMLEAMIRDFDRIRPVASEIRLFPLVNSDAEAMVEQLRELFQIEGGGAAEGEAATQLVLGGDQVGLEAASVGQELRFTADSRTNTIIAAGAEVDLLMVEQLIQALDASAGDERVREVYKARHLPADEIAQSLQNFIEQEEEPLADLEDAVSKQRLAERKVSIEAVTGAIAGTEGASEAGGSKLLLGVSPRYYEPTMQLIRELDQPEPQVMIRVLIAEVTLGNDVELGMEFAVQDLRFSENAILGPNGIIQGADFDHIVGTDIGAAGLGLGGLSYTITGEDFNFLFHALQTDSRLEVLSRPVVLVQNGEEGTITIADQIPVITSSVVSGDTGTTTTSTGRENAGIELLATPHISPDGYVTMQIEQNINNLSGENVQLSEGLSQPIITERSVTTNVTLRDGETVVIGGLITSRESTGENKVPILGDIPGLGALFRFTRTSVQKTELLVVLNVSILRTEEDRRQFSEEERDKFVLPDSIRTSPLMEGLRIRPDQALMGPKPANGAAPTPAAPPAAEPYGPKPKTYGPTLPRPSSTTTTTRMIEDQSARREPDPEPQVLAARYHIGDY